MNLLTLNTSIRRIAVCLAVVGFLCAACPAFAQRLISHDEAARLGLKRAWFAAIAVDPSRGRVENVLHDRGALFARTSRGTVHAIDAESGATLWTTQVGNPDYPSIGPSANEAYVAVINGSTMYALNRSSGKLESQWQLSNGPSAGPCLLGDYAYAPLLNGTIEAYQLSLPDAPPWRHTAAGRALAQPTPTTNRILWPTERRHLNSGSAKLGGVDFRVETNDEITVSPAYSNKTIYAASAGGYLYALDSFNGHQDWRVSIGQPIRVPPAAVLDRVFVCSIHPEIVCVDAATGDTIWRRTQIARFVAVSTDRVYAVDAFQRLRVLDISNGAEIGVLRSDGLSVPIHNVVTDRIFLASPTGLIQCLHELDHPNPLNYAEKADAEDSADEAKKPVVEGELPDSAEAPTTEDEQPVDDNPFGDE